MSATSSGAVFSRGAAPVVSVVIPCLNEEDTIAAVVADVLAQGVNEVVVADGGSADLTA